MQGCRGGLPDRRRRIRLRQRRQPPGEAERADPRQRPDRLPADDRVGIGHRPLEVGRRGGVRQPPERFDDGATDLWVVGGERLGQPWDRRWRESRQGSESRAPTLGFGHAAHERLDGQPSTGIGVQLAPSGNALATAEAIKVRMGQLSKYFPEGMKYSIPYDSSRFIKISIRQVVETLLEAVALVFVVMFVFLQDWRYTLIPTIVVPVALLGTFGVLLALGYSINVLTMFGMVLVIGIVVDDAIVVVENVERIMSAEGLPPLEATRKAMGQIQGAIVGVTVVLISVFVPLAFFGGAVGNIYRQFSTVMVASIGFSAFMALSLTPALCGMLLKPVQAGHHHAKGGFFGLFNRNFEKVSHGYEGLVGKALGRVGRRVMIMLFAVGVAATAAGAVLL